MPNAAGVLADAQDYRAVIFGVGERDGVVGVGAEPGVARVKASADRGAVVIEDYIFAVYDAGELGVGDFDLRVFVSGDAGVGDSDSPQHGRGEICGLGDGVDVSGFIADFIWDAGIGLGEGEDRNKDKKDSANSAHGCLAVDGEDFTRRVR